MNERSYHGATSRSHNDDDDDDDDDELYSVIYNIMLNIYIVCAGA